MVCDQSMTNPLSRMLLLLHDGTARSNRCILGRTVPCSPTCVEDFERVCTGENVHPTYILPVCVPPGDWVMVSF